MLEKTPLNYKDRSGVIYVFKYKDKKTDNSWKLATVGLLPTNEAVYAFDEKDEADETETDYSFTEFTQIKLTTETTEREQVKKLIKKLIYSKRKSAAQSYSEDGDYNSFDFSQFKD